jgi:hypothetical protein
MEQRGVSSPLWIHLTPNGKTLVAVYRAHDVLADTLKELLGEPEAETWGEVTPKTLLLLFPHQNLPEDLKDIAERMTSESILTCLEEGIPVR